MSGGAMRGVDPTAEKNASARLATGAAAAMATMDNSAMAGMDHSGMDHSAMSGMDHGAMGADGQMAGMDHGGHAMGRSEEHTSELQSLMRSSYAVFCLKQQSEPTI